MYADCLLTRSFQVTFRSTLPGDLQSETILKLAEESCGSGKEVNSYRLDVWEFSE